ncbi:DUF4012 domain-containing protein [Streptomyces sp. PKU-MA01144]|uniref:DUF4012 domain-containing protein n=1 Tax=Streptomyces sp. PKU-MA01144 TaxID=2729138 RepID=UPI00147F18F0|nr:DUF4012 domain-containing protein [Streptomyces sp. PKU-MA01144]NNJ07252.1 DUF4012 domain-containing protein [Streptomyces sp. PKU-MA01144]
MPRPERGLAPSIADRAVRWCRRRPVLAAWCAVTGLVLAGAAWIAVTGLLARHELQAAQRTLESLRHRAAPGGPAAAPGTRTPADTVRDAAARAAEAHRLTTGPAWYTAAHLPVLGDPVRTVRGAAEAADRLTRDVLSPLADTAGELVAGAGADGGHLDLSALRRAAPALHAASRHAAEVRADVAALPRGTWLPAADRARALLAGQLDLVVPATAEAAVAARLMPSMLGERGPRRYLVVFENTAEARGTGGLPGAFAILTADRGRLGFERFGNDGELAKVRASVDLGAEYTAMHGRHAPTGVWVNSNVSPHFPHAARIWSAMWRAHSGQRLDGAFALDPGALAGLLTAAGPAKLPDGTSVTAANVVDLTERTSYAAFPDTAERKAFFLDVARATSEVLLDGAGDPARRSALFAALRGQLREGRVKVWSAHPSEQRELASHPFGGVLPDGPAPFAGLVVNNAAGTKLDFYLDRRMDWRAGRCTAAGREVTVTASLTNRAPGSGLPAYVTQRVDRPPYRTRPGDNRLLVSYYATEGARLARATVDGRPAMLNQMTERGHPVYTVDMELPRGATRTLVLELLERPSDRPPLLLHQRLVQPLRFTARPPGPCDG